MMGAMRDMEGPKKKVDGSSFLTLVGLLAGAVFVIDLIGQSQNSSKGLSTDYTLTVIAGAVALGCILGTIAMRANQSPSVEQMPPPVPPGSNPARWAPDPSGKHRLRWWDGERWTDQTHD
jgi:hypothetical protein